jgi:hypothetical protein
MGKRLPMGARNRVFRFVLTDGERLELERLARLEGVSVAEIIRRRALRGDDASVTRGDVAPAVRRLA